VDAQGIEGEEEDKVAVDASVFSFVGGTPWARSFM
jgi:hypothetical protein